MAASTPMSVPPGLKPVTMYVRRAEKLDKAPEPEAPVVAYHCRLYATEQAMKLQDNTEEGKGFLRAMIGRLEEDKQRGMSGFSQEEGQKMTTDWAMREFNAADEEDRAGLADQSTARSFYAAGVFFDVLRQFGSPDEEMDRRRIYCKWKASQILKAIKEGRTPTPGGAGEDVVTGMPAPAPAPSPARPRYDPSARPKTPVPSASGSRRSGGSRPMEGNMADAMEHCRFALRALEKKDVDLAVQKLQEALQQLT